MRFFEPAFVAGIPLLDAEVQAGFHLGPKLAQPFGVAADAPLTMNLHDTAKLAVARRVEIVRHWPDGQRAAELLVAALVLRWAEFRLAQRPLQGREQMRNRLRVVPNVRAGAGTTPAAIRATFPAPEPPVRLTQHRRRFQNREVRRHRFDNFRRQRRIVEAIAEPFRVRVQFGVMVAPVFGNFADVLEMPGIPRLVAAFDLRLARFGYRVLANPQIGLPDVPRQPQHEGLRFARPERERHEQRRARRRATLGHRWALEALPARDLLPRNRERVEPPATKPGVVHLHRRIVHRSCERAFLPTTFLWRDAGQHETARCRFHRIRVSAEGHEVLRAPRKHRFARLARAVREPIFQRRDRQARVVCVARLERTPTRDFNGERHVLVN
jgi:hypothetical protein